MNRFLRHALGAFVRLFGVVVAAVGAFVAARSFDTGVPMLLFGVALALRPHFLGKMADWARIPVD